MRKNDIEDCLRLYRKAVAAFGEVTGKLNPTQAIAVLRQPALKEVEGGLDRIGDGLSVVPELAEELLLERRICALLRDQAARAGLTFQYREEDGMDSKDEEDDEDDLLPG